MINNIKYFSLFKDCLNTFDNIYLSTYLPFIIVLLY